MKLDRFRSDWNGQRSDTAYHQEPTIEVIKEALANGKARFGNCVVFAKDKLVEVRLGITNGVAGNTYRDFYSIK